MEVIIFDCPELLKTIENGDLNGRVSGCIISEHAMDPSLGLLLNVLFRTVLKKAAHSPG